LTGDR